MTYKSRYKNNSENHELFPHWKKNFPLSQQIIPYSVENDIDLKRRTFLLGNSVVPFCVGYALTFLSFHAIFGKMGFLQLSKYREKVKSGFTLRIPPSQYVPNKEIASNAVISRDLWATPTASVWSHYRIGGKRALTILSNQIMYDILMQKHIADLSPKHKNTTNVLPKKLHQRIIRKWIVNPQYIEYLMGYPLDWTQV